jgi:hypothetical protein
MTTTKKSVRELGGEFWAELNHERESPHSKLAAITWQQSNELCDFLMSVLARHVGSQIANDEGLEVTPRPLTPAKEVDA